MRTASPTKASPPLSTAQAGPPPGSATVSAASSDSRRRFVEAKVEAAGSNPLYVPPAPLDSRLRQPCRPYVVAVLAPARRPCGLRGPTARAIDRKARSTSRPTKSYLTPSRAACQVIVVPHWSGRESISRSGLSTTCRTPR